MLTAEEFDMHVGRDCCPSPGLVADYAGQPVVVNEEAFVDGAGLAEQSSKLVSWYRVRNEGLS